jgi:hypothetical protein
MRQGLRNQSCASWMKEVFPALRQPAFWARILNSGKGAQNRPAIRFKNSKSRSILAGYAKLARNLARRERCKAPWRGH